MKNSPNKYFLILIFVSAIFAFVICSIGNEKIFLFINKEITNPVLDFFVLYIFNPLFLFLGIIPFLMIFTKKDKSLGIFSLVSGFLCYLIGHLIKSFFAFPRPYDILPARILGPWHTSTFSFPSTTTMLAFGLALPILLKKPKLGAFFLMLAFLVGFSVIYTGFHFPHDVIAGILFSILIVFILEKIYDPVRNLFSHLSK